MKDEKLKISIAREIVLPTQPNFIRTKDGIVMAVKEFTQEELKIIGSAWLIKFIKRGCVK